METGQVIYLNSSKSDQQFQRTGGRKAIQWGEKTPHKQRADNFSQMLNRKHKFKEGKDDFIKTTD